jgi:hypothetical protein
MMWRSLSLLTAVQVLGGCASSQGLSHDALVDVLRQEEIRFVGVSASNGTPTRPNTPALGLYLKPTGHLYREFEWTSRDRDALLAWSRQVPLPAGGKSTGFLTLSSLRGESLTELRATAARYGVDWLLTVDGAAAVDRYNNYKAGLLYWTIVGAYLADGTHSDALCLLKATLWDVKTGAALFEEEAEAQTKTLGPAAQVDDKREIERARTAAMQSLIQRLTDRFSKLKEETVKSRR